MFPLPPCPSLGATEGILPCLPACLLGFDNCFEIRLVESVLPASPIASNSLQAAPRSLFFWISTPKRD